MALFERAFRPFFLFGALFSALAMWMWWRVYPQPTVLFLDQPAWIWHAHEMVYGYALATVTGFLLTAVLNWTRSELISGRVLAMLFVFWLLARLGYLLDGPLWWVALFDLGFNISLMVLFLWPVIQAKQWKQVGLGSKFVLLFLSNALFYLGLTGLLEEGVRWGLLLGLFLVLAINLTMMRRVMPFFTEMSLKLPELPQSKWLDALAIIGFLILMILATFYPSSSLLVWVAIPLTLVHIIRWMRWYQTGIWSQLLLWPLYLSYAFMIVGMGLYAFVGLGWISESVALHAFAVGGIGLLCSAIVARVGLAHTQRNIQQTPRGLIWVFVLIATAAIVRVALPIVWPQNYLEWMVLSQWFWALAFALLAIMYAKILWQPAKAKHPTIRL